MTLKVSAEDLLEKGAHFGHQAKRWNPKMSPYIYGKQEGVHIFDLIKTKRALEEALNFLTKSTKEGKVILLVGCKKQAQAKTKEAAETCGCAFYAERWLGGTLTNFGQISKSVKKLTDMKQKTAAGDYTDRTKKERLLIDREIARLERFFGGISSLVKIPDILVVVDTHKEAGAIREAKRMGVVTVGIVDSNSDPGEVDYPIPMNDDATAALEYVLDLIKEAILAGKQTKPKSK